MLSIFDDKGVSLVELLVVMLILAIGLLPIAIVQTRSQKDVFQSSQRTEALNIAQRQMERAKSMGFSNAAPDSGIVGPYTWNTSLVPAGNNLRAVTVTVQWEESGENRVVTYQNLLSRR